MADDGGAISFGTHTSMERIDAAIKEASFRGAFGAGASFVVNTDTHFWQEFGTFDGLNLQAAELRLGQP